MFSSKFNKHCLEKIAAVETGLADVRAELREFEKKLQKLTEELQQTRSELKPIYNTRHISNAEGTIKKNPEFGLVRYLYSYLSCTHVLDIGANVGDFADYVLKSGFQVISFEPNTPVFEQLVKRFETNRSFKALPIAVGSIDTKMTLHLATDLSGGIYDDSTLFSTLTPHSSPSDLQFKQTLEVPVRSLESLHKAQEIPKEIGLVKIDTEGFDLEVIKGMGEHVYPVVIAEFWDEKFIFGKSDTTNKIPLLVPEMAKRGYNWFLVMYRIEGSEDVSYYLNHNYSVEKSWGNIFFFRDFNTFSRAVNWCASILPETILF